jgi:hypothetical protein
MRVSDDILKSIVFIGTKATDEPPYRGTAFLVSFDGAYGSPSYFFLVTARHIATKLEGSTFVARMNRKDEEPLAMEIMCRWWYHPQDPEGVDIAVTHFTPPAETMAALDFAGLPVAMFATETVLENKNIGIGDQVFIAGLFTNVQRTSRNIPIIRSGNIAMIPDEPIPFADKLINSYLIETRSIGGLSGSPVFVRSTLSLQGFRDQTQTPVSAFALSGTFYLLGSMIGHWDLASQESLVQREKVNMGISAIVPAQQILEVLNHPELIELRKKWDTDIIAKRDKNK